MNWWPFISQARYEDREREILELKRELAELKYAHARIIDRINFRSTGFHIDERFAKEDAREPSDVQPATAPGEPSPVESAPNMTARRRQLEITSISNLDKAEAEARAARGRDLQAQAAARLEEALQAGKAKAQV